MSPPFFSGLSGCGGGNGGSGGLCSSGMAVSVWWLAVTGFLSLGTVTMRRVKSRIQLGVGALPGDHSGMTPSFSNCLRVEFAMDRTTVPEFAKALPRVFSVAIQTLRPVRAS